jgi:hypothetical protein
MSVEKRFGGLRGAAIACHVIAAVGGAVALLTGAVGMVGGSESLTLGMGAAIAAGGIVGAVALSVLAELIRVALAVEENTRAVAEAETPRRKT